MASPRFQRVQDYDVLVWSISGHETVVIVRHPRLPPLAFDMGVCLYESVGCAHVFISHGHLDHVGAIQCHMHKRNLRGLPEATYYVPAELVAPLTTIFQAFRYMSNGCKDDADSAASHRCFLVPVKAGDVITLPWNVQVTVFQTVHCIPSVGFLVHKMESSTTTEEIHSNSETLEIGKDTPEERKEDLSWRSQTVKPVYTMQNAGSTTFSSVHHSASDTSMLNPSHVAIPMVAYLGDTKISVFHRLDELKIPHDLLRVQLLFCEATYIDRPLVMMPKAEKYWHIHLHELIELGNSGFFNNVGNLLLHHFSDRYSVGYTMEYIERCCPSFLKDKLVCCVQAKQSSTFVNYCSRNTFNQSSGKPHSND